MKKPIGVVRFLTKLTGVSEWGGHPALKQRTAQGRTTVNMAAAGLVARQMFKEQWPEIDLTGFDGIYCRQSGELVLYLEGGMLKWATEHVPRHAEGRNFHRINSNSYGLEATISKVDLRECICRWFTVDSRRLEFRPATQVRSFFRNLHNLAPHPDAIRTAKVVLETTSTAKEIRQGWETATMTLPAEVPLQMPSVGATHVALAHRFPDLAQALGLPPL